MNELAVKLRCTGCRTFRDFERVSEHVVRCGVCEKRHSTDSLHAVADGDEAFPDG